MLETESTIHDYFTILQMLHSHKFKAILNLFVWNLAIFRENVTFLVTPAFVLMAARKFHLVLSRNLFVYNDEPADQ